MRKLTRKEATGKKSRKEKKLHAKRNSYYYDFRNGKVHPIPGTAGQGTTPTRWLLKWARLWGRGRRAGHYRVADNLVHGTKVSTVFLGLNHSISHGFSARSGPVLFETMTFPHGKMWRYHTYREAVRGHRRVVAELLKRGL